MRCEYCHRTALIALAKAEWALQKAVEEEEVRHARMQRMSQK